MPSASFDSQELSPRALLTGVLLGALLLGCGFWRSAARLGGSRDRGPKESSISQTAASAAASIVSKGLVAPIPAHASITGESLDAGRCVFRPDWRRWRRCRTFSPGATAVLVVAVALKVVDVVVSTPRRAVVIPASISIVVFLGAAPEAARRFTVTLAAGLVAGESIAGVVAALVAMVS